MAAKYEKKKIDVDKILKFVKNFKTKKLVIEGAGGLNVPINSNYLMSDLCQKLDTPLILVSRTKLGTINHTLMSFEVIKKKNKTVWNHFFWKKRVRNVGNNKVLWKKNLEKKYKNTG